MQEVKMADRFQCFKWCFVPCCKNTNLKTPSKIFLAVPRNIETRRQWAKMARREDADSLVSVAPWYCCEDHFNVSIMGKEICCKNLKKAVVLLVKLNRDVRCDILTLCNLLL